MTRFVPLALLLSAVAGCCCCGSFGGGGGHVAVEELSTVKSLNLEGFGDLALTVGSEPYSINTDEAFGSSSTLNGSELSFTIGLGDGTASLPQLDSVIIAEMPGLNMQGVDVSDLTITKAGLGTVVVAGTATNVTVTADDLCTIDLSGLTAENVTVNITGSGTSVEANATGTINVTINGDGNSVDYTGGATLTENITGSSSVTNLDDDGTSTDGIDTDGTDPADGAALDGNSVEPTILDGEGFDG